MRLSKISFSVAVIILTIASTLLQSLNSVLAESNAKNEGNAKDSKAVYVKINQGDLDKTLTIRQLKDLITDLTKAKRAPSALIFELDDAENGNLSATTHFAAKELNSSKFPIISFINTNAGSSATVLACASDKIFMSPNSVIGGSYQTPSPTNLNKNSSEKSSEKKSAVSIPSLANPAQRAQIRAMASERGRSPEIAEAFFNPNKEIKIGKKILSIKGEVLALNTEEALQKHAGKNLFADYSAKNLEEVFTKSNLSAKYIDWKQDAKLQAYLNNLNKDKAKQAKTKKQKIAKENKTKRIENNESNSNSNSKADDHNQTQDELASGEDVSDEGKLEGLEEDEIKLQLSRENIYKDKIVVIRVGEKDLVRKPRFRFMRRVLKEAKADEAKAIVFYINTPGGYAWETSKLMIDSMQEVGIPTYAFVKKGISAGALIASSADVIYMSPFSTIGSAAVVSGGGAEIPDTMQQKIYSTFKSVIRSICKKKNRRWEVVEAFMDKDVEVIIDGEVISKAGELLSLDSEQATRVYSDGRTLLAKGIAENVKDMVEKEKLEGKIVVAKPSMAERIATHLTAIAGVLLLLGIVGAYMEAQAPGFGVPGTVSIICFALFFFSFYVDKLTGISAMVVLFIIGLIFLAIEIFLLPGTIVFGLLGAVMILTSIIITMADIPFKPQETTEQQAVFALPTLASVVDSAVTVVIVLIIAVVICLLLMKYFPQMPFINKLVLKTELERGAGIYEKKPADDNAKKKASEFIGKTGTAQTDLRPSGKVLINGKILDATTETNFVAKGDKIEITEIGGMGIKVRKI